jgi:hypothetical protein
MSIPRFRRGAQFDPTQIAGCALWLDANDVSTVTGTTNVTNVRDKSGNGVNLSNATGYSYPNNTFNGTYPSFYCPNGFASSSSATLGYNTAFALTMPFSLFFVGVQTNTGTYGDLCDAAPGGANRIYTYTQQLKVQTPFGDTAPGYTGTNFILWVSYVAGTNASSVWINGNSIINGTIGQFTCSGITVANRFSLSESFPGHICEVLAFNTGLSSTQQQNVEGYLAQKWGLRSNLPGGHQGITTTIYPTQRLARVLPVSYSTQYSPLSIAGCVLWLDASDSTKISLSGSSVTQMIDKSTNAYTLTGSAGTYPTQTTTLNGLPVISSASGKYLTLTSFNQNFTTATCFIVARPTEDITPLNKHASGYPLYVFINGSTSGNFQFTMGYANQAQTSDTSKFTASINKNGTGLVYGQLGGSSISTYNPVNTILLMSGVMSGTLATNFFYVNGASVNIPYGASGTFASQTPTLQCIGLSNGQSFGYDFAECIVYGATLTSTQIQQVESYLAQKWGLTSNLPAGHLNQTFPAGTPSFTQNVFGQIQRNIINLASGVVATGGDSIVNANGYRIHTFTTVGSQTFTVTSSPLSGVFQVLVVGGGGGGGGYYNGGGGGAGGAAYTTSFTIAPGSYTVTVGGGGGGASGGNNPGINGTSGTNSSFLTLTGNGGGGGGADNYVNGLSGGCGGGMGPLGATSPGSGTQGYAGGYGTNGANMGNLGGSYGSGYGGGGGGGMGSVGSNALTSGGPGWGGLGKSYTVGGQTYFVAAGGGGGTADTDNTNFGLGGSSIGGNGGLNAVRVATSGAANTGSGGGGYGRVGTGSSGGSGGSGTVIIAYPYVSPPISFAATGGTIITSGSYTYHLFTGSGSFTISIGSKTVNYLVVGGGGGGGDRHGGGGGAGGVLSGTWTATSGTYTVTVGAGGYHGATTEGGQTQYGTPNGAGSKGGDSSISSVATAYGGGGGGSYDGNPTDTLIGSGGGGGGNSLSGVAGTSGQGNSGGSGQQPAGGGGGGASAAGANANSGTGGNGTSAYSTQLLAVGYGTTFATSWIIGTATYQATPSTYLQSPIVGGVAYIAAGGGGASYTSGPTQAGGYGGGGTGDWDDSNGLSGGTTNTGSGGGASRSYNATTVGRDGGSGLVLLWYLS